MTAHAENPYVDGSQAWLIHEGTRLATMSGYTAHFTRQDLEPLLQENVADGAQSTPRVLDIGSGTSTVAEELCTANGAEYFALDPNQAFLSARATPEDHKIGSTLQAAGLAEGSFDITRSCAVTAWQFSPTQLIAQQLRATGRTAVFSEFDWTDARVWSDNIEVHNSAQALKSKVLDILTASGFQEDLGARLGYLIDASLAANGITATRRETRRHTLPEDDYRDVFLDTVETVMMLGRQATNGRPVQGEALVRDHVQIVREAAPGTLRLRLPALVTEIVDIDAAPAGIRHQL